MAVKTDPLLAVWEAMNLVAKAQARPNSSEVSAILSEVEKQMLRALAALARKGNERLLRRLRLISTSIDKH